MTEKKNTYVINIELISSQDFALPEYIQKEQKQALQNFLTENRFQPLNDNQGPYTIKLSIEENRLVMRIKNATAQDLNMLVLSLKPYKRLIQDYFLVLNSYEKARQHATREKLEAIDMGRRGIHNEGADLLLARLKDKIDMDFETARKLFTLICVLHKTHIRLAS